MNKVILICGPTSSRKTEFAHELALRIKGEIVNLDSMQVYKYCETISVSPESRLKAELPYHLYNFLELNQHLSAKIHAQNAAKIIFRVLGRGRVPILVSGSGMYINSLIYGYHNIPDILEDVRLYVRSKYKNVGIRKLFECLVKKDPLVLSHINKNDTHRILRAYEVILQTGKSIYSYYTEENLIKPIEVCDVDTYLLVAQKNFLNFSLSKRVDYIFHNGGIEEAEKLYSHFHGSNNSLSGYLSRNMIGLKEIFLYLDNKISFKEAIDMTVVRTRQYAKRQKTWFFNKLKDKNLVSFEDLDDFYKKKFNLIEQLIQNS